MTQQKISSSVPDKASESVLLDHLHVLTLTSILSEGEAIEDSTEAAATTEVHAAAADQASADHQTPHHLVTHLMINPQHPPHPSHLAHVVGTVVLATRAGSV